jgi:hypothetical protein
MGNQNYAPNLTGLDPVRESQILLDDSARPVLDNVRKNATSNGHSSSGRLEGLWSKYSLFASLIITTVMSSLLLASSIARWTESGRFYHAIVSNRASTQLAVQLISYLLGLIQVTAICRIINYSTRLRMEQNPVSLDMIHLWSSLSAARMDWNLRLQFVLPLLAFISITSVPAALWAGAITPVPTLASREATMNIPKYDTMSLITEYPSEVNKLGPILRTSKGMFSYSVGMKYLGSLLSSAATATPLDGNVRLHPKYDNSRFVYAGRSYGVGSSPGLTDDFIFENDLAVSYSYRESGYEPIVHCIYNQSSEFVLSDIGEDMLYAAKGNLPDSNNDPEYSVYVGHGTSAIVAIGVAHPVTSPRRHLAIAAGSSYALLNATQCTIDFNPSLFDVSVGLPGRNITVTRLADAADIDPTRNLTKTAMRQLELISNDQTNLYVSLVGDSLNSSIADYISATSNQTIRAPTEREAVLAGLTNSFTAMVDDILVSYASAQLMIAEDMLPAPAIVRFNALRFGQDSYIYAIATINGLVVLCVISEAARMRGWKGLLRFNYLDPRSLIVAASRGGKDVAYATSKVERSNPALWKSSLDGTNHDIGQVSVLLRDGTDLALVLASRKGIVGTESINMLLKIEN